MNRRVPNRRPKYLAPNGIYPPGRQVQHVNRFPETNEDSNGEISIEVQIPNYKCSLSSQRPFRIGITVTNHTQSMIFTPEACPFRSLSEAHTRGPVFQFLNARTSAVVASYRLELCKDSEWIPLIMKSGGAYTFDTPIGVIKAEHAVTLTGHINDKSDAADDWCTDLLEKLVKGKRYRVKVLDNAYGQVGFQKLDFKVWFSGGADMFSVTK